MERILTLILSVLILSPIITFSPLGFMNNTDVNYHNIESPLFSSRIYNTINLEDDSIKSIYLGDSNKNIIPVNKNGIWTPKLSRIIHGQKFNINPIKAIKHYIKNKEQLDPILFNNPEIQNLLHTPFPLPNVIDLPTFKFGCNLTFTIIYGPSNVCTALGKWYPGCILYDIELLGLIIILAIITEILSRLTLYPGYCYY